jgi:lysozyme
MSSPFKPPSNRTLLTGLGASAIAVALIAGFEGYSDKSYDDGVGVQTIGFGSTRHQDGAPVKPGDTVTPQRAVVMLARDADRIAQELAACIGDVPLYKHEWDAYVSWAYNVGAAAACRSTLVKKLKATLTPTLSQGATVCTHFCRCVRERASSPAGCRRRPVGRGAW